MASWVRWSAMPRRQEVGACRTTSVRVEVLPHRKLSVPGAPRTEVRRPRERGVSLGMGALSRASSRVPVHQALLEARLCLDSDDGARCGAVAPAAVAPRAD